MTHKETPTFVIVGDPNAGKTTLVATLAEDDQAAIAPVPGTTRHLRRYPVKIDGEEIMVFFDTPGFENSGEVLEWLRDHREQQNPAADFIANPEHKKDYPQEYEILQPLAEGAAVIYTVDGDIPPCPVDEQQAEILRHCSVSRIGVINCKKREGKYLAEWKRVMLRDLNLVKEFNACHTGFADRIRLLQAIKTVVPDWEERVATAIEALQGAWEQRLSDSADAMLKALESVLQFRKIIPFDSENEKKRVAERAKQAVEDHVRKVEQQFRKRIREIFRHNKDHWALDALLEADIFTQDVWDLFGLSKKTIIVACVIAGASSGFLLDLALGGAPLGLGTLIGGVAGGVTGGVAAFYGLEHAVKLRIPRQLPFPFGGRKIGGTSVEAKIPVKSSMAYVLIGRMLVFAESAAGWAHGRQTPVTRIDPSSSAGSEQETNVVGVENWSKDERHAVMAIIALLGTEPAGKIPADKLELAKSRFREIIVAHLKQKTMMDDSAANS